MGSNDLACVSLLTFCFPCKVTLRGPPGAVNSGFGLTLSSLVLFAAEAGAILPKGLFGAVVLVDVMGVMVGAAGFFGAKEGGCFGGPLMLDAKKVVVS